MKKRRFDSTPRQHVEEAFALALCYRPGALVAG
jgi:hypothetical protein